MNRDKNSLRNTLFTRKNILFGLAALSVIVTILFASLPQSKPPQLIPLSAVAADLSAGKIARLEDRASSGEFTAFYHDGEVKSGLRDLTAPLLEQLSLLGVTSQQLANIRFEVINQNDKNSNSLLGFLLVAGLIGTVAFAGVHLSKNDRLGKRAFKESEIPSIRFADVAGMEETLQELRDIVTFLQEGERFAALGARAPRGILMVGDPGTGKTLIAKAVAGEAGVPFFATSGSEFVEVFVGVGASRMRSLFQRARRNAPCIIFIDEVDAVGRERHRSESGSEMEQDQTLNQLLVEMDGFGQSDGIVVLAATNRVDVLDPALIRPGRFDRRVYLPRPDIKGRAAILKIHAGRKKLAPDVDLERIAKATPGLVGADLANIINEAAIKGVQNRHSEIQMSDIEAAVEKILAGGVERKSQVMSEAERRLVAYHEAGHAIVIHSTELGDPVYKVSIIPRGQTSGYTMSVPEEDQLLVTRRKLLARITGLLGGRASEEFFFQDISSGAANDLKVATQLAEEMVMRLGMDASAGLRVFPDLQERPIFSLFTGSQKTQETIDEAVNNILTTCYGEARQILMEKRGLVERVSGELLEFETINRERFIQLVN